jgi:hypothetical protein
LEKKYCSDPLVNVLKRGIEPGLVFLGLEINYKEFGSEKIQLPVTEKLNIKTA